MQATITNAEMLRLENGYLEVAIFGELDGTPFQAKCGHALGHRSMDLEVQVGNETYSNMEIPNPPQIMAVMDAMNDQEASGEGAWYSIISSAYEADENEEY